MMENSEQTTSVTIKAAARRAGVDVYVVRHCVEIGLVDRNLTERDLAELRRIRRLMALGVNLPGVEVILRMRRHIQQLQAELIRLERQRWS
jgi:DNA-binding transcriptional MerR regulator